jgi:xanthine dehydrogenase YagS FAD-binding subunit
MRPFHYSRASDAAQAITQVTSEAGSKFLGGGTNLVDLMKMGVEQPAHLVDIQHVPFDKIEETPKGLRIGAMVRNSAVSANPIVMQRYPLLSQALLAGASPQIRNMATVGGNLLQRTRCPYFYDPSYRECNKRTPGSGCAAIPGYNRMHAILGSSDRCIATHPSDMAVALMALDASIVVRGARGERTIPIQEFYRLPGDTPQIETDLKTGELITAIDIPAPPAGSKVHYLKVRDRNSYAFALVSVAALISMGENNRIREAGIALGGVALKPWRVPAAEAALRGREATDAVFHQAAEILIQGAKPHKYNAFKVELARRSTVRALQTVSGIS